MKFPKYLTTVTPLSKTIALAMFIIFPICAFFLGGYYQHSIDADKPEHIIVEYKTISPSPTPSEPQDVNGTISCRTTGDCPSGYRCIQGGPIRIDPATRRTITNLMCWKNGMMIPL